MSHKRKKVELASEGEFYTGGFVLLKFIELV